MKNTVLISDSGIEIYQSDIDILISEYIESLPDETLIYKASVFNGLLLYIYNNKLKYVIETIKNNKGINQYNIDYDLLNDIFQNVYLPLTYRFNIVPTVLSFACFVHVSNTFLSEVKTGTYRKGVKVNSESTETVKNWYQVCESSLADKAFNDNGIGAIFGLKANYAWTETAPTQVIPESAAQSTPEQIQQRYKDVEKPVLPVFEDET